MLILKIGAVAGDVGAPLTPGDPVGPTVIGVAVPVGPAVIFGQIDTAPDFDPGSGGGFGVPRGNQIIKGQFGLENGGEEDGLTVLFHSDGTVTQLVGMNQIDHLTGSKGIVGGQLDMIANNFHHGRGQIILFHI